MKKILLTLVLTLTIILPVFAAANWVPVGNNIYMDTYSVKKYNYMGYNYGNYYSIWIKRSNDCSEIFLDSNNTCRKDISHNLTHFIMDCNNDKYAVKGFTNYDYRGHTIDNYELSDYQITWSSNIPDSVGSYWYNYACNSR